MHSMLYLVFIVANVEKTLLYSEYSSGDHFSSYFEDTAGLDQNCVGEMASHSVIDLHYTSHYI